MTSAELSLDAMLLGLSDRYSGIVPEVGAEIARLAIKEIAKLRTEVKELKTALEAAHGLWKAAEQDLDDIQAIINGKR